MPLEKTLVILKPSAVERGLIGEILSRLERKGLRIIELKMLTFTREKAEMLYEEHEGKDFYEELVEYMAGKRVVAAVLEGEDAISVVRNLVGATDPKEAAPGTIRGDFGISLPDNLIHACDSPEKFEREYEAVFKSHS